MPRATLGLLLALVVVAGTGCAGHGALAAPVSPAAAPSREVPAPPGAERSPAPPPPSAPIRVARPAAPRWTLAPAPWPCRRGMACPGDPWGTIRRDARDLPATFWDDTRATFGDPRVVVALGIAGAVGAAIHEGGVDDRVARHNLTHGESLSHFWDSFFDALGNPGFHFGVAGAMYLGSLATGDAYDHEVSKTAVNALAVSGLTTVALKLVFRTDSPNGDPLGWPSGHTSSSFALATVLARYYGPAVGVPAYALAAMVGYERVDAKNHDVSDVVSGAILGTAIAWAVCRNHDGRVFGWDVAPVLGADGAVGVAFSRGW